MPNSELELIDEYRRKMQNQVILTFRLRRATLCLTQMGKYLAGNLDVVQVEMLLAIYDALIISYASCFSQNHGHRVNLDAKKVFKNSPELLEIHKRTILIRNSLVAHNGQNASVEENVVILQRDECYHVEYGSNLRLPTSRELSDLNEVIGHSYEHIRARIERLAKALENEIGKPVIVSQGMGDVSK